jgi:uncharacterized protein
MKILPVYASLLAFLFVYLSIRVIGLRRTHRVGLGHGDNPAVLRAMRVHANFAEYVPLALLLIFFVESMAAPAAMVHGLGAALVIARLLHAYGVSQHPENFKFRATAMVTTFTVLVTCATYLLVLAAFK